MNYSKMLDFTGKTVLITGGTGSIGSEFARAFASCGADVAIADINPAGSEEILSDCEKFGRRAYFISVDLFSVESIEEMVSSAAQKLGKIDVLCNHAGFNNRKNAVEYTEADWDKLIGVDLKAVFFVATATARHMIERKTGKIITTASVSAARGHKRLSIYASAKGGIRQMTKVLAHEWAEHGITVNAIGPGYVVTKQTEEYVKDPEIFKYLVSHIPMGRLGAPADMASVVLFLASEGASYITGQTIFVEGGRLID
ncbi:MAG: glucose 1-dehydrogenase [Synergistaceae bacterium]|jgi:NAD(P)-dependent dehydrogenase (short-subunit alcohol dehydrogenase family)|nr:glucose 1-dehydrogenase [Synergistaceae bacterium]